MKKTLIACLLSGFAGFAFPPVYAASSHHDAHGGHGGHGATSAPAPAKNDLVDGVVKRIDKAGGKVTVAHGPLVNLNMSQPMTMVFRVKDASWLDQMRVDDKIRFIADSIGGTLIIVYFEAAK
ncbi:MAG: copper-binding protein [Candidatus Accumulibacter sp.]|jgi:Cu/Ag efflux protein CusF|nr:copper-binding protein [Accumulibacter sp.]